MTNAEKYLKDGVDVKQFAEMIDTAYVKADRYADVCESTINWLNEQAKPTLTEDERAILRNIDKKYKVLEKENGELRISTGRPSYNFHLFTEFQHLFQFIKERRKIFY